MCGRDEPGVPTERGRRHDAPGRGPEPVSSTPRTGYPAGARAFRRSRVYVRDAAAAAESFKVRTDCRRFFFLLFCHFRFFLRRYSAVRGHRESGRSGGGFFFEIVFDPYDAGIEKTTCRSDGNGTRRSGLGRNRPDGGRPYERDTCRPREVGRVDA